MFVHLLSNLPKNPVRSPHPPCSQAKLEAMLRCARVTPHPRTNLQRVCGTTGWVAGRTIQPCRLVAFTHPGFVSLCLQPLRQSGFLESDFATSANLTPSTPSQSSVGLSAERGPRVPIQRFSQGQPTRSLPSLSTQVQFPGGLFSHFFDLGLLNALSRSLTSSVVRASFLYVCPSAEPFLGFDCFTHSCFRAHPPLFDLESAESNSRKTLFKILIRHACGLGKPPPHARRRKLSVFSNPLPPTSHLKK